MDTHTDLQAGTQAQTQSQMGAHANMPSLALVSLKAVTHRAVQSGDWSDPATWENGDVPTDWAKVHIPAGVDVRIDGTGGASVKTVRVDGTLSFATDVDTTLKVDTLVTTDTGHLIIGTEEAPISANVDAKIIFADDGAIDKNWDPSLISRGALLHGKTTINGAEKTAYGAVSDFPMAGDQSLTLKAAPMGWKVGDKIVIARTNPSDPSSDETVTITAIDGAVISFQPPLALNHAAPKPDLDVHVANLTRNIEFSSENEALAHRGHVMVMHTNDAAINYAGFEGLGRSDKRIGYNDHEFVDLSPFIH